MKIAVEYHKTGWRKGHIVVWGFYSQASGRKDWHALHDMTKRDAKIIRDGITKALKKARTPNA